MRRDVVDDGLAKIGNTYFMVRSPVGGATHAINPKTKKTYCGKDMLKLWDKWRPIDKLPDDKNQPTCKVCQRHYDDPIKEEFKQIADELRESIDEFLFLVCTTKDAEGLGLFTTTIATFMRSEKKRIKEKREAKHE